MNGSAAQIETACRAAECAGVPSSDIIAAKADARRFAEFELHFASQSGNAARIEKACRLAEVFAVPPDLVEKARALGEALLSEAGRPTASFGYPYRVHLMELSGRQHTVAGLRGCTTLLDLARNASQVMGVPVHTLRLVLHGAACPLSLERWDETLRELGIDHDTVLNIIRVQGPTFGVGEVVEYRPAGESGCKWRSGVITEECTDEGEKYLLRTVGRKGHKISVLFTHVRRPQYMNSEALTP